MSSILERTKESQALSLCKRETHNPHAIKGHLVMEILHHVIPPLQGLGVGEVREGCGARPNLKDKGPELSGNTSVQIGCIYYLYLCETLQENGIRGKLRN